MRIIPLLLAILSTAARVRGGNANCQQSEAEIRIVASQNQTGHWALDLSLEQATQKQRSSVPLRIHLKPKTKRCGTTHVSAFEITLRGSPLPPDQALGYDFLPNLGYYKMNTTIAKWEEAKAICESEGTHLAILNSEAEAAAVKALVDRFPKAGDYFHMGFSDIEREGHFVTIFDEPLQSTGYNHWGKSQPSNGTDENCGVIARDMLLRDYDCDNKTPFICELEI